MSSIIRTINGSWGWNDQQGTRVETFSAVESLAAKLAMTYTILPEEVQVRADMDDETKRLWSEVSSAAGWSFPDGQGITRAAVLSFRAQEAVREKREKEMQNEINRRTQ